jgi:RNA polymerase sigma-70 factor (ECF subfamily)
VSDDFEGFFRAEYRGLVVYVRSLGARHADAEDAASEAMLQAHRRWRSLRQPRNWTRKAAYHAYLQQKEKSDRLRRYCQLLAGKGHLGDAVVSGVEGEELVRQALGRLPSTQAAVVALTLDGYRPEEIAEILGKSSEAVRSSLREARRKLREWLDNRGHEN